MDKSQRGLVKKAMRGNPKDFGTLIQEELATYTGVDVGNYGQGAVTATINGEAAAVEGVNPFYEREGQWVSTMTLAVPPKPAGRRNPIPGGHPSGPGGPGGK